MRAENRFVWVVVPLVVVAGLVYVIPKSGEGRSCSDVDAGRFRAASVRLEGHAEWSPRHGVSRDLSRCHTLIGRSRRELRAELGRPHTEYGPEEWYWVTGPPSGLLSEPSTLIVRFRRDHAVNVSAHDPS